MKKYFQSVLEPPEAWESAGQVAKAFAIGRLEAAAVLNLTQNIRHEMVVRLRDAVRLRGMRAFRTHECIAKEVFNLLFTSGTGALEPWAGQLANREDNAIASWLLLMAGLLLT